MARQYGILRHILVVATGNNEECPNLVGGPSWNLISLMASFFLTWIRCSFNLVISFFLDALGHLIIIYQFAASLFYFTFL